MCVVEVARAGYPAMKAVTRTKIAATRAAILRGSIIGSSWEGESVVATPMVLMEGAGMGVDRGAVWLSLTVVLGMDFGSGGSAMRVVSFLGATGF